MEAEHIQVGIIMGSDSDLPVMQDCANILEQLGVGYEVKIASAHRTPEVVSEYAAGAVRRGLKVLVAAAGGAAHLPGVVAAWTSLPVIGVPILSDSLRGVDSLLSVVQMPAGVPVATVGINGAKNAGLLAAQIIGLADRRIAEQLAGYRKELAEGVEEKDTRLARMGVNRYLAAMERQK